MIIQYYGDFCFKITTKPEGRATQDVVIWTDPLSKGAGLRSPIGEPDILLLSHNTDDYEVKGEKTTVLDMPGEFAARGVTASGYGTFTEDPTKNPGFNTAFIIDTEGMQIGYLGNLGHEPSPEILDRFSGIDLLFVPVESKNGWDIKTASGVVKKIEPKIIIPMHFAQKGLTVKDLITPESFVAALGGKSEVQSKLNIKKKDIESDFMRIIILEKGA
jgi:L-ascorbate metabolism protein UlaG (beta-lactamase superfamily)